MPIDDDELDAGLRGAKQHEVDRQADPYSYSELADFAELDTWRTDEALMLLAGIAPTGAVIKPSFENVLGVRIDKPTLVNAQLLSESDLFYWIPWQLPNSEEDAMTPAEQSEVLAKRQVLRQAEQRYQRIVRLWESSQHAFLSSWPPQKFLDWAEQKNIEVPWRNWYETNRATLDRKPGQAATERKPDPIGMRAERTFLNMIGGLLGLMLGKTPAGRPQSEFKSQSAIIEALLATYPGKPGISQRTLEQKFAEAKRAIDDV